MSVENMRLLSPAEVAEILGVKESTLATWRSQGRELCRFVPVGRLVKYRREDVEEYIAERSKR
jgi:excisionase family DNA binding protein